MREFGSKPSEKEGKARCMCKPKPDCPVHGVERQPCPRDSDWCDGVICVEQGIDCPNADAHWTLYRVEDAAPARQSTRVDGPRLEPGERVRVAPVETLERYEKALQQIDAFMGWDRPDSWKVEKARELARGVLGSSGRPEKETG
jgi:hypothetical protein